MNTVINWIIELPLWMQASAAAVIVLIVALIIGVTASRRRFVKRVRAFVAVPGKRDPSTAFTEAELLRRTRILERLIGSVGEEVVRALQLDRLWTERLHVKKGPGDYRRVLAYGTERGLFACFLVALQSRRLATRLRQYLADNSDFLVLRRLALSGRGEQFNGEKALVFFSDRVGEIREMTGDPEWPSRYFAVKILLHDSDDRSDRALWDGFRDPHPLVRKTLASEYKGTDRTRLYETLEGLFLHDPVFEVRQAARLRIRADFADLYSLSAASLQPEEALHVIGLLDPNHSDDVNAAMELLAGANLELRLAAARFLAGSGALRRLFLAADFADREEMTRIGSLLRNALEVNVVDFLGGVTDNPGPASLLIAAQLLASSGPQPLIVEVAERAFRLQEETTENHREIFTSTVDAIAARGTEDARRILAREIGRRKDNPALVSIALAGVRPGSDHIYRDPIVEALKDPSFPERDALRSAFLKLDTAFVLSTCIDIITAGREKNPHRVRIDALLALGELRLPYTLQDILEHLPILPVDVAREFTRTLHEHDSGELERKVRMMLDGVDGNIRAAVIAALPATGKKTFLPEIRKALDDADPDVRIAATWSLVDYEETRALAQAVNMLRDPVPRVRESVARALAIGGGKGTLESLRDTLFDANEVDVVKQAAIEGLGASMVPESVDVLVAVLEGEENERTDDALWALAAKTNSAGIRRLVELFKDADPALRDRIAEAFTRMGEAGEVAIRDVLEEDIAGMRPYLAEILETTGYVESRIRLLSHRDPRIRRDAADFLSRVGSEAAFRGIVMAARDPDSEVRVQVTRALERLASDDGKEILHALENDPDRRIRRYTHWALERLAAKAL